MKYAKKDEKGYWLTSDGKQTHFHEKETSCPCGCGFNQPTQRFIDELEKLRQSLGLPVCFTKKGGCCRCTYYNEKIKGSPRSRHLRGEGGDLFVVGTSLAVLYRHAERLNFSGLGYYPGDTGRIVHADTGDRYQRWIAIRELDKDIRKKKLRYVYFFPKTPLTENPADEVLLKAFK